MLTLANPLTLQYADSRFCQGNQIQHEDLPSKCSIHSNYINKVAYLLLPDPHVCFVFAPGCLSIQQWFSNGGWGVRGAWEAGQGAKAYFHWICVRCITSFDLSPKHTIRVIKAKCENSVKKIKRKEILTNQDHSEQSKSSSNNSGSQHWISSFGSTWQPVKPVIRINLPLDFPPAYSTLPKVILSWL